jgi:hypothetical protein
MEMTREPIKFCHVSCKIFLKEIKKYIFFLETKKEKKNWGSTPWSQGGGRNHPQFFFLFLKNIFLI